MRTPRALTLLGAALLLLAAAPVRAEPRLKLETRLHQASGTQVRVGTYRVFEDRAAATGREIELYLIVLPATGPDPRPDPIFWLMGGPGGAATGALDRFAQSPLRRRRDIVLVDQRGTGRSHPLRVPLPGSDENLQGYLDPLFDVDVFRRGLRQLEGLADLTKYTTPIAMDDLDEVRHALGYEKINVTGGSYGTRAALVYLRRHPNSARTAVLNGVAPISFVNPLYHAAAAQEGWERILLEIESDPAYRKAFPDLDAKLHTILARLDADPAEVTIPHPTTGEPVPVRLTRWAFAEALRVMMYYTPSNRQVPLLVLRAHQGDLAPFAKAAIRCNRSLRDLLCFGMLMSVTGGEDLPRIDPEAIERETADTFLGDQRVRSQLAVGAIWPRGDVGLDYGEPVCADVPVLLLSGTHDPVTPPRWGEAAARHLPRSLHLTVPGAHGVGGPIIDRIVADFLEADDVEELDLTGLDEIRLPRLALP